MGKNLVIDSNKMEIVKEFSNKLHDREIISDAYIILRNIPIEKEGEVPILLVHKDFNPEGAIPNIHNSVNYYEIFYNMFREGNNWIIGKSHYVQLLYTLRSIGIEWEEINTWNHQIYKCVWFHIITTTPKMLRREFNPNRLLKIELNE